MAKNKPKPQQTPESPEAGPSETPAPSIEDNNATPPEGDGEPTATTPAPPEELAHASSPAPPSLDDIPESGPTAAEAGAAEAEEAVSTVSPQSMARRRNTTHPLAGRPNSPSFNWNPEKMSEPVLDDGDRVVSTDRKKGIDITNTANGQQIFHCTMAEYEEKIGQLVPIDEFAAWFPHAAPKKK